MATLTPSQVTIIKSTVPVLKERGTAITSHFYRTLLSEKPELNNIFNQANQHNGHQAGALASALYAYAANIDDLGVLSPAVEKICNKHASLYIQPEHYKIIGEYLLRAMGDVLGAALTPEMLEAWGAAYWQLANVLIGKEEELYQKSDGWRDWRDFRIAEKVPESSEITSFYLEPVDGEPLPQFLPGQYISIMTDVPKLRHLQPRQYSLSDAPDPTYYRISVKKEAGLDPKNPDNVAHPGHISNILHDEKGVGEVLQVSHPHGEFSLDPTNVLDKPVVLLSAGVGVTPMVSITNTLIRQNSKQPISFVHGSKASATRAFHPHLQDLAARHSNLQYATFVKNINEVRNGGSIDCTFHGRVNLDKLDRERHLVLNDGSTEYFVCGPQSFMEDVAKGLQDFGVPQGRIHLEVFGTGMP